jgi:ribose transport system substrate-binding protein
MYFNNQGVPARRRPGFASRRLAATCSVAAIAVGLSACGSSGSHSSASTSGAATQTSATASGSSALAGKHVAIIGPENGDTYYEAVACGAQHEGRQLGLDVGSLQSGANQSQAQEDTIVQSVLQTKPAGIIYTPADAVAGVIPLRAAAQNHVAVVDIGVKLSDPSVLTSFVYPDLYGGAVKVTKMLAAQIGGSGQIAAIGSLASNPITEARIQGFNAALKAFPNIHVVSVSYPPITPSAIQSEASSLLVKYPNLKAFYTTNFIVADGVAAALRNAQLAGKVKVASWDTDAPNVKLLQEGVLTDAVAEQPYATGELAIQQIANKLMGKPTQSSVVTPVSVVTNSTVNTPAGKKQWYTGTCSGG